MKRPDLSSYGRSMDYWDELINQWIFSERDRAILKRRLLDGIKIEDLAGEFFLSSQQIKTILYRNQSELFKHAFPKRPKK